MKKIKSSLKHVILLIGILLVIISCDSEKNTVHNSEEVAPDHNTIHALSNAITIFNKVLDNVENNLIEDQEVLISQKDQNLINLSTAKKLDYKLSDKNSELLVYKILELSRKKLFDKFDNEESQKISYTLRKNAILDFIKGEDAEHILNKYIYFQKKLFNTYWIIKSSTHGK